MDSKDILDYLQGKNILPEDAVPGALVVAILEFLAFKGFKPHLLHTLHGAWICKVNDSYGDNKIYVTAMSLEATMWAALESYIRIYDPTEVIQHG